jgi:hypothetical protein
MRIYIIGSDGITLCHKPTAKVNEGEIAVASNEELHAAPLSAKRLLALWNALPGVEKRKKVGDRDVLIDQLWSAIELLPDPELQRDPKGPSKQDVVIAMLGPDGSKAGLIDVIRASTAAPAAALGRIDIKRLQIGVVGDATVLELADGDFEPGCPWRSSHGTATAQSARPCGGRGLVAPAAGVSEAPTRV